ncbi:MAG: GGDEF domain-containing protein [Alphaproteobacteria bacterium]
MKIGDNRALGYARAIGRVAARKSDREPLAAADSATVLDIPEAELTPKVRTAIMSLMAEVQRLRDEIQQSQRRIAYLEQLADEDTLVPVVNRRAFVRELSRVMSYGNRYNVSSSVLYFDVNGMKTINDLHGHAAGDAALTHVARVLSESVRESDIVGRLGGDEFGVILAHSDQPAAKEKAQALTASIERTPFEWKGQRMRLQVSFGTYTFGPGETADAVLDAADRAMYAHKQTANGRA